MKRDLEDYQKQYADQPYERFQVIFRKRKILEILERYPHKRMLEVGCGMEPIFDSVATFDSLVIVEPADMFFEAAREKLSFAPSLAGRVTLQKGYLGDFIEQLKRFKPDFILLSSLLHEVLDPELLLKDLHAIALHDTVLHINVPNAKSLHRLLALEMKLISDVYEKSHSNIKFQQNSVFDLDSLSALARRAGFVVLDSGSYAPKIFTHRQMEELIQSNFLTDSMVEGLYKMGQYLPDFGSEIFINIRKQ